MFAMEHNFLLSNDIIAYVKMICNMHIMRIIFAVSILVFLVSSNSVTVQPCISYIHKPASELSVAALQLMFTHFRNERLFNHKKVLNNTMNKLIVLPIIFLWLNCYQTAKSITKKSSICHIRVLYLEGSVLLFTRKHISFQPMNL